MEGLVPKQTAVTSMLAPCRGAGCELGGDLWVTHIRVDVPALPSEPATLCPSESYLLLMNLGK